MFVDEIRIFARAGHGGKGCIAFQREKYRPKGGPSGGNGGRGGDVILEADHDLNNLIAQYYNPRLLAEKGEQGLGKGMDGHAGKDLVVKVPCGTLVWRLPAALDGLPATARVSNPQKPPARGRGGRDSAGQPKMWTPHGGEGTPREAKTWTTEDASAGSQASLATIPSGESQRGVLRYAGGARALEIDLADEHSGTGGWPTGAQAADKGELIADLTQHGQQFVLCQGGRGGLGNRNFATSVRQTPRFAQPGEPGQEGPFLLELRIIADVGLVGYPNAGKSTLLTAISKARPKVAPYPFTTLHPQIGIVEYGNFDRLVVCDVPGLIEGAHRNVGLGHEFLRHIERCRVLVLLLDMAGTDGRAPWEDYRQLLNELGLYDAALLERPRLVVANKMDEPAAGPNLKKFKRRVPKMPVLPMAAAFDEGTERFKQQMREAVAAAGGPVSRST
jgi:GTPase